MSRIILLPTILGLLLVTASVADAQSDDGTVVVEMKEASGTEYVFEPSRVEVSPGQTIRFVQEGAVPHNVEFKDVPAGAEIDGIRMGPFLMAKGETYEIRINRRFTSGTYDYVCTPHEMMGMVGTIVVQDGSDPADPDR